MKWKEALGSIITLNVIMAYWVMFGEKPIGLTNQRIIAMIGIIFFSFVLWVFLLDDKTVKSKR